jgi:antitoxin (DNA-binding transcriptional repressor) of toxin-antitoxin stability system
MIEVTIRDLRNQGGKVLERVERGEVLTASPHLFAGQAARRRRARMTP